MPYPAPTPTGLPRICFLSYRQIREFAMPVIAEYAEQARIEAQGVSFIQRKGCDERGGIVSTFLDPDGNYVQLLQNNERVMA